MTNKLVSKRELEISLTMRPVWELKDLFNLLDHMPLVDGGFTRHGHWIKTLNYYENGYFYYQCSQCGYHQVAHHFADEYKYCTNCGAKMDEVEDETD